MDRPLAEPAFAPGDFYEDCGYHPRVCLSLTGDDLVGISLVDGTIGSCSVLHCGPVPLDAEGALRRKVWFGTYARANGWAIHAPVDAAADELAQSGEWDPPEDWPGPTTDRE